MATPRGLCPTGIVATFVLLALAITLTLSGSYFRDVDVCPIRGDGYPNWAVHRDRGHHRVGGRGITETLLET